jgi:hypothetical protein
MMLPAPRLDERSFDQLMAEARRQIALTSPEWSDLSAGDPGVTLLELFAHLTETMIYRLNHLPEQAYVAFLRLLGVSLQPPAAATALLRFSRDRAGPPVEIPRGTRVTTGRPDSSGGEPPIFTTAHPAVLAGGETAVEVLAYHCDLVEGELLGSSSGLPGATYTVRRPPIIAPTGDALDLLVGVETPAGELDERAPAVQFNGKSYRLWRAVENFSELGPDRFIYLVDRLAGTITFAPAARLLDDNGRLAENVEALAAVPPAGREIRVWYRRGGGPAGNVAAHSLTALKDNLPGLQVSNPAPATGGQAAETVANALGRGPRELHSLRRATTAADFELIALNSARAVARAKALTRSALWRHAAPGTVELLIVPHLPEGEAVTAARLWEQESEVARDQIQQALDERRPLGTQCVVNWAHYKTVRVAARIVVGRPENRAAVRQRVLARLDQAINPLPTPAGDGWPFGQTLRASDIYSIALAEPGVRWVDRVRLLVDEVPDKAVTAVAADFFQPQTWYAGSGPILFRSLNDGASWEAAGRFEGEPVTLVRPHPGRPGLVAVVTRLADSGESKVYVSADCGENWQVAARFGFAVLDVAWAVRGETAVLFLATEKGLYELPVQAGGSPVQLAVQAADADLGFYAVAAATDVRGGLSVAVAGQNVSGVYLSSEGGRSGTFRLIGLQKEDVRRLAVQMDGPRTFLWAGVAAAGTEDPGKGCFRWELRGAEDPAEGWRPLQEGWKGGSCRAIAFLGGRALAASHRAGVLWLEAGERPVWQTPDVRGGLPMRDPGRFHPVESVAAAPSGAGLVMAGGPEGVFASGDEGVTYQTASAGEFLEKVALPETWLFVSGAHEVTVVSEDEAS